MSRDYKPAPAKSDTKSNPFLNGLILGLLIGVAISVALTLYLKGGESAFSSKNEPTVTVDTTNAVETKKDAKPEEAPAKDRFEYFNILPSNESKVTEQEIKQLQIDDAKPKESYFLQVGAFQTEEEANNVKAKLALLGLEAVIQTASTPDHGIWHRVRVGPFADPSQITKTRSDLVTNGFKPDLIKVNASSTQ
jgi:cell division protein FtsN